ncbi:MAG: YlxR family protein [Synergistaceae bacterium]|nr:YlxR family protein [Synergistaceae bacterium]
MKQRPRTCVGCREEAPKREMLRIVRTPDGEAEIDPSGRMPGRGAYLCLKRECVENARKKDALSKALKIKVNPGIYDALLKKAIESGEPEKKQ